MDAHDGQARGRSHSATSAGGANSSLGSGLGADPTCQFRSSQTDYSSIYNPSPGSGFFGHQQSSPFSQSANIDPSASFAPHQTTTFGQQLADNHSPIFGAHAQDGYLNPGFAGDDVPMYSAPSRNRFNNTTLFGDTIPLGRQDTGIMPQSHSVTPPHLLKAEPGSANHSPNLSQQHFSPSSGQHSRNASLGPEAALLPRQVDWVHGQFQRHRRSPSEYSDVSSAAQSPNLHSSDSFEQVDQNHSPMQRAQDPAIYQELHGLGTFTLSEHSAHSPSQAIGRSPSHSPAMSPRLAPQQAPDMNSQNGMIGQPQQHNDLGPEALMQAAEAFPQFQHDVPGIHSGMPAPPSINIDYAPSAIRHGFEQPKSLDIDSLTPPELRGRPRQRPRAVTDPYNSSGALLSLRPASTSLSPAAAADEVADPSRSLSPLDRSAASSARRRRSTSAVPNNAMALRLADPNYDASTQGETGGGGSKRAQKHPATFQCTLCPKRFTRAYNLRSHLRTHTDERPFVCTVCGKAFARQHDRKRHEGLHSGEKKFVCKGELQAGGQWGCGRRFARADALGRHFRSEAGRICIKPLLDEEMLERQRVWNEQRMQQTAAQGLVMQQAPAGLMMPGMDPNAPPPPGYPMDAGHFGLPAALLAQYPALALIKWSAPDMGGSGLDDEMSGRSSFEASDYDEADDGGYVSGPGTGFGQGGMQEDFGEMAYASDYGGR